MSTLLQRKPPIPSIPGYRDLELVGEGATSRVFRAVEESTGATVALKLLHSNLRADPVSIERFRRETKIMRALSDEHVVAAYALLECDGRLALIMEFVDDGTLKDLVRERAPRDTRRVKEILRQLLSVLARCHGRGIVHRDLKPQNILLGAGSKLKLVDFGIARMASFDDLTRTGATLGSPEYMAPELFASSDFDPRADLYAVGVIAFEMLTGKLPYRADTIALLYAAHRHGPIRFPSAETTGVPPWLDDFVVRLLAKDPFDRYQTSEEALADLLRERVPASKLPPLGRRECLACGGRTLEDLLICAFCGYHHLETFLPGDFDVRLSPDADPEKLKAFLERLGTETSASDRTDVLVRRVDKTSAELLKDSLRRHGLYASVTRRSLLSRLGPVSLTLVCLAAAVPVLGSLFPWLFDPEKLATTHQTVWSLVPELFALGLVLLLGVRVVVLFDRRERGPELLSSVDETLSEEYGWMSDLVPFLARVQTQAMRHASARLVEKYFVMRELTPGLPVALSERIERVLSKAVELASFVSEIDELLEPLRDSHDRTPLSLRQGLSDLVDRRGALECHLARTTSLFNRLVGEAVDSKGVMVGDTAERLDEARRELEHHIEASREIRHELEAFS